MIILISVSCTFRTTILEIIYMHLCGSCKAFDLYALQAKVFRPPFTRDLSKVIQAAALGCRLCKLLLEASWDRLRTLRGRPQPIEDGQDPASSAESFEPYRWIRLGVSQCSEDRFRPEFYKLKFALVEYQLRASTTSSSVKNYSDDFEICIAADKFMTIP